MRVHAQDRLRWKCKPRPDNFCAHKTKNFTTQQIFSALRRDLLRLVNYLALRMLKKEQLAVSR